LAVFEGVGRRLRAGGFARVMGVLCGAGRPIELPERISVQRFARDNFRLVFATLAAWLFAQLLADPRANRFGYGLIDRERIMPAAFCKDEMGGKLPLGGRSILARMSLSRAPTVRCVNQEFPTTTI
jgi:hypothetical protein